MPDFSYVCPDCKTYFKVFLGSDDSIDYCPICGSNLND